MCNSIFFYFFICCFFLMVLANFNNNLVRNIMEGVVESTVDSEFNFFWNVPTFQCKSHGIYFNDLNEKFGIIQNDDDVFRGEKIAILYDPGSFPALLKNSSNSELVYRNGGIPQKGDLNKHLEIFQDHLQELIPDESFSGLAIIDFESWRPVYRQNFGTLSIYKEISQKTVQKEHPFWPASWVQLEAVRQFEKYARLFMEKTLTTAKKLRPAALWGYYAFPYCFNMNGNNKNPTCPNPVPTENDKTSWLFESSQTLYPSLYLSDQQLSPNERQLLIKGRIAESKRILKNIQTQPKIVPYFWYKYQDTKKFLSKTDLINSFSQLKTSNIQGVIIWGSSNDVNTKQKCSDMKDFIYNTLGPIVANTNI